MTLCESSFIADCLKNLSEKSSDAILTVMTDQMNSIEYIVTTTLCDKHVVFLMQMQRMLENTQAIDLGDPISNCFI
jgi:hypothetical protein